MVRRFGILLPLVAFAVVATVAAPSQARLSKSVALSSVKLYLQQASTTKDQADRDTMWAKAARVGQEGLLDDPTDPELNMLVGKAFSNINHGKEAGEYFSRGIAALDAKRTELAKSGAKLDKKQAGLLDGLIKERYNAALPFRNKGAEAFQEGQRYQREDTPAFADSAKAAFTLAISMFTQAMQVDPTQTDMFPQLAFSYIFSNQKKQGREVLLGALAKNPADTLLTKNLALVDVQIAQDLQATDVDGAVAYLLQADSLDTNGSYIMDIANMLLERGVNKKNNADLARAEGYYTQVLAKYPPAFYVTISGDSDLNESEARYKNALNNLAESQRHAGKIKEAMATVENLLYLEPRTADVWNIHAYCLQELKLTDRLTSDLRVVKALRDGKKADVASALAAGSPEVKAAVAKYGDPGDVYFYIDATSQKKVVTYFFWKGGVAITTAGGVKLSETIIPKLAK